MYSTIKINRIPDMKNFMELIVHCKKPVYIDLGDTEICDLKSNETARRILTACSDSFAGDLKLRTDSADSMLFLNYLINAA